jgi:hypothetical protein
VEAGDLTTAESPLLAPASARRPYPALQLGLTSRSELRRAIVLMTVLGPCKAEDSGLP